ncbi:MAG: SDR family NAD(P)-dependent oxidoreductase [Elusimicrobia bacterium]|nr:SDR family NAD(P)-dependent oxidoreductase [Elusimicrobiota bacterium]
MSDKKYAVITGGSSGLGLAFAKNLAAQGMVPLLIARRKDILDKAVASIKDNGHEAYGFAGDITAPRELTVIAADIQNQCGAIDFLILNAGVVTVNLLGDYADFGKLKEDIEVDLWGTVVSTKIFLPLLKPGAKILMISSALGLIGAAGYSTYCAAKAGVINFAEALRRELLCKNIAVYVACPADIDTPQYAAEKSSMPAWMTLGASARQSLIAPEEAAGRILTKCTGKRFLITINSEISLLCLLKKLLPWRVTAALLDFTLPRPK